ncbi:MAG: hypothetical protein QG656_1348, partial [Candidatus Hydrogenedentes bacterium]|nr:hypothetical protein [Candidatus Hydrogenedentota bacterium]
PRIIVTPIRLASNQEVYFEPGVVVLAKAGEFKGKGDSLFTGRGISDMTLRGYGATWRMRKPDYQSEAYEKAEWRMTLDLLSCNRVTVLGLRLESSGGDGIYVGVDGASGQPYCQDITIRDVTCIDHHRQGISVISAVNLLIENCLLSGTRGTAPEAGIDFEPNSANEKLVNCVMRDCVVDDNAGAGVLVYVKPLSRETAPIDIHVERCHIRSGEDVGIGVGAVKEDGPQGLIEFKDCTVENTKSGGIFVYDKDAANARVRFENCRWKDVGAESEVKDGRTKGAGSPLLISLLRSSLTKRLGGIDFVDCRVYTEFDRPVLVVEDRDNSGVYDLHGRITVHSLHAVNSVIPETRENVDLVVAAP